MAFYVGQKVVCVDDSKWSYGGPWDYPRKGSVYTVDGSAKHWSGGHGILIREIKNVYCGKPQPFLASRFRPVVEKKTDISIFTALLNPANHKQLEGV